MKNSVEQIRQRFDNDVERFSNLETGQAATIDAPLVLELITQAAGASTPRATDVLDIGCGAGNYTLKLLSRLPNLNCTLVDLSRPMLERARERIAAVTTGTITTHQTDVRDLVLPPGSTDIILAAAVLHHLRTEAEWLAVFTQFYAALRPGGSIWISDLIEHSAPQLQSMMWARYGDYLTSCKNEAYRDHVFAYVAAEDSPKPLMYQLDLLRKVGFQDVDVLHKNSVFAAFGGTK